jgi:hypothetical protein
MRLMIGGEKPLFWIGSSKKACSPYPPMWCGSSGTHWISRSMAISTMRPRV